MVEYLEDLQTRSIKTRPELNLDGVFSLGDYVLNKLKYLRSTSKVKGAYFSHYPEQGNEPHVKVGIRYDNPSDLEAASNILDNLCTERKNIVADRGKFEQTTGEYKTPCGTLPPDIVVDYIICHSFDWLLKAKAELGDKLPPLVKIADFLWIHRTEISTQEIGVRDIIRKGQNVRPLTCEEHGYVFKRFVHHFLNAYRCIPYLNIPEKDYEDRIFLILNERILKEKLRNATN